MKYGETLRQRSIPAWSHHNIDYDDIKLFIKEHTTPGKGKTVAIPGHVDQQLQNLENSLFDILRDQHTRIDLFVRSKTGEITRRLNASRKQLRLLAARQQHSEDHRIPVGRLERYSKLENEVIRIGDEIKSLARFNAAQRTAFRKLLKKHKKWTGSTRLEERFRDEVLDDPKSFTQQDLGHLLDEYSATRQGIRILYDGCVQMVTNPDTSGSSTTSSTVRDLQEAVESDSKVTFDTAIATVPLGEAGTFATFFVHPENVVELQIFLLQYAQYFGRRSRTNSVATPVTPSSRHGSIADAVKRDFHMIVADSVDRFVREQSSLTVDDREHLPGSFPQRTRACVRWNDDEHAMACLRMKSGKAKAAALKRKHARAFFDRRALFSTAKSAVGEESEEEVDAVRREVVQDASVQPLFHFSSSRSRMVGNTSSSSSVALATLDTNILIGDVDDSSTTEFPFALLLVRQEGNTDSDLLTALNDSHLVERVRGFSLEYHAVWAVHRPKNMPPPFWLPILSRDIRKLPPPLIRHDSRAGSTPRSGSGESRGSVTAVETTNSSLKFDTPPLKAFRKKKRQRFDESAVTSSSEHRYWSEYDHPEDGEGEDPNAYVLYIDPNEKSFFDAMFERIGGWFGMKNDTYDSVSPPVEAITPAEEEEDEMSSDEESGLLGNGSGTVRRHHPLGSSSARKASARRSFGTFADIDTAASPAVIAARRSQAQFVPQFATMCFVAGLVILALAYFLAFTGRHRYIHAVDAGVISAIVASLVFVVVGFLAVLRVGMEGVGVSGWAMATVVLVVDAVGSGGLIAWIVKGG